MAHQPKLGKGHGGNSKLPPIQKIPTPAPIAIMILRGQMQPDTVVYQLGRCRIFASTNNDGTKHLSISHEERYPTWDEVAKATYELLPEGKMYAMILPPKEEYINIHNYCFQVHELVDDVKRFSREG